MAGEKLKYPRAYPPHTMTAQKPRKILLEANIDPQWIKNLPTKTIDNDGLADVLFDPKLGCTVEQRGKTYVIRCPYGEFTISLE